MAPRPGWIAVLDELRALVAEANALTLAEYAGRLAERTGVRVSGSTLCRALHRPVGSADISARIGPSPMAWCAKTLRAEEQDRPDLVGERAAWRAELAALDPDRLVFLDESGIDTRLTRTHARAARGSELWARCPGGTGNGLPCSAPWRATVWSPA